MFHIRGRRGGERVTRLLIFLGMCLTLGLAAGARAEMPYTMINEDNTDRPGFDKYPSPIAVGIGTDPKAIYYAALSCVNKCKQDGGCRAWTYVKATGQCWLKDKIPPKKMNTCCMSGYKKITFIIMPAVPTCLPGFVYSSSSGGYKCLSKIITCSQGKKVKGPQYNITKKKFQYKCKN